MLDLLNIRPEAEKTAARIPDIRRDALKTAFQILHGQNPQRKTGSGEAFWQFREYSEGDLPRDIDWRQSGKTDRVYTRQTEKQSAQTCLFWCKRNTEMQFQSSGVSSKHHTSAVIALTLALLHSRSGEMIGFLNEQRPGHSEKTLDRFESLLMYELDTKLPKDHNIPKYAHFYALSDFWEPLDDIEAAFTPLSERTSNGCLIHIIDPAEMTLPYSGRVHFSDSQAAEQVLIHNVADIRDAYKERIQQHISGLQTLCKKWEWTYLPHITDQLFENIISSIWMKSQI